MIFGRDTVRNSANTNDNTTQIYRQISLRTLSTQRSKSSTASRDCQAVDRSVYEEMKTISVTKTCTFISKILTTFSIEQKKEQSSNWIQQKRYADGGKSI